MTKATNSTLLRLGDTFLPGKAGSDDDKKVFKFIYQSKTFAGRVPAQVVLRDDRSKATVVWKGKEKDAKNSCARGDVEKNSGIDCVLLFNEEKNEYVLERVHQIVHSIRQVRDENGEGNVWIPSNSGRLRSMSSSLKKEKKNRVKKRKAENEKRRDRVTKKLKISSRKRKRKRNESDSAENSSDENSENSSDESSENSSEEENDDSSSEKEEVSEEDEGEVDSEDTTSSSEDDVLISKLKRVYTSEKYSDLEDNNSSSSNSSSSRSDENDEYSSDEEKEESSYSESEEEIESD
eukprot:g3761.t1